MFFYRAWLLKLPIVRTKGGSNTIKAFEMRRGKQSEGDVFMLSLHANGEKTPSNWCVAWDFRLDVGHFEVINTRFLACCDEVHLLIGRTYVMLAGNYFEVNTYKLVNEILYRHLFCHHAENTVENHRSGRMGSVVVNVEGEILGRGCFSPPSSRV